MTGVSPASKIYAVRGQSLINQPDALKHAAENVRIINLSYSHYTLTDDEIPQISFATTEFQKLVKEVNTNERLFVSTAGNEGQVNLKKVPCDLTEVLCIGGTTNDNKIDPQSNFSSSVEIFAPYNNLVAINGTDKYRQGSGTSFAAPLVAGAVSIVWEQHPLWETKRLK